MRPPKERRVEKIPPVCQFKPVGVPIFAVDEMIISVEEMEALRLSDVEDLDQAGGAESMGVSRPTFHRILTKARQKIAKFLWEGRSLRVEGGAYRMKCCGEGERHFRCNRCGHEWEIARGQGGRGCEMCCPECGSSNIVRRHDPDCSQVANNQNP